VEFSVDLNLPAALWHTQRVTEIPGIFVDQAHKADNITAICEPIVYRMWEPQRLTTTACYRDSFTLFLPFALLRIRRGGGGEIKKISGSNCCGGGGSSSSSSSSSSNSKRSYSVNGPDERSV
jgi:hypothetical protein